MWGELLGPRFEVFPGPSIAFYQQPRVPRHVNNFRMRTHVVLTLRTYGRSLWALAPLGFSCGPWFKITVNIMDSRAMLRILYRGYTVAPTKLHVKDPCPCGVPTVAHVAP